MKKYYRIKKCDSCGKESNDCTTEIIDDSDVYIVCPKCKHANKYNHSKHINENIMSMYMVQSMALSIHNLMVSGSIHYLVDSNASAFLKDFKQCNSSNLKKESLKMIEDFIKGEDISCFKNVDIPFVPNFSYGVVSGLDVFDVSYSSWFFKVLEQGINPFTGKGCLVPKSFYDFVTLGEKGNESISWRKLWIYVDKKIGLREYRDVLEAERREKDAEREFYYHYALENDLQRDFDEVMETTRENLSNDEKRFSAFFNMHKESDEYLEKTTPKRDFFEACLKKSFSNNATWSENLFDLREWEECYWAHVVILDKLTKGHPARREHLVYFKDIK